MAIEKSQNPTTKKRAHKTKITIEQIAAGIKGGGGTDLATAAWIKKHYGISVDRSTISGYVRRNPELQELKNEVDDELLDLAIVKLRELIHQGDKSAIFFEIKYKGKKRGYVSQYSAEISNKDDQPFRIKQDDAELKQMPIREIMKLAREIHESK